MLNGRSIWLYFHFQKLQRKPMSLPAENEAIKNHLFAALSKEEFVRLEPHLEFVSLQLGEVIYESGDKMTHIYFPTTAIISMLYIMENGATAEIGIAGNNGLIGSALFMGGKSTSSRAVVQSTGHAIRIKAKPLQIEFDRSGLFQKLLLRYIQSLMTQISQTAVCNRLHNVDQQLCRWLLINHDQLETNELVMTQELIANMLGVRREGVTIAAKKLQERGLIKYVRGTITVINRKGLEDAACECYQIVMDEYDRLLGKYIPINKKRKESADNK